MEHLNAPTINWLNRPTKAATQMRRRAMVPGTTLPLEASLSEKEAFLLTSATSRSRRGTGGRLETTFPRATLERFCTLHPHGSDQYSLYHQSIHNETRLIVVDMTKADCDAFGSLSFRYNGDLFEAACDGLLCTVNENSLGSVMRGGLASLGKRS